MTFVQLGHTVLAFLYFTGQVDLHGIACEGDFLFPLSIDARCRWSRQNIIALHITSRHMRCMPLFIATNSCIFIGTLNSLNPVA
jgi:hypothetical protein